MAFLKYIEKSHWITFSIPCVFEFHVDKGSVWADPVGQMCGRCRPYRSAARGRFARVLYSFLSQAQSGKNNHGVFCVDRWGERSLL